MSALSTVILLVVGCSVHVGVLPITGTWAVSAVEAPVAEPDVDAWTRDAVASALAARGALDPAGGALRVTVRDAAYTPSRRAGDVLLYEARLTLEMEAAGRTVTRTRAWTVRDPGDAASARSQREASLRTLATQVAEDCITALLATPAAALPPSR